MNFIDKIYVIHYAPLKDRKEFMLKQFELFNITNYEFHEGPSRLDIDIDKINTSNTKYGTNLTVPVVAISISHVEVYRKIITNNYKRCLILEDDAVLCSDFNTYLSDYINSIPADFDMAFINSGCNMRVKTLIPNTIWYKTGKTRTCCAYIITKTACEIIIPALLPFRRGIDLDLNDVIQNNNLNTYWCEPTLVIDGSEQYGSSHDTDRLGKYLDMYLRYEL